VLLYDTSLRSSSFQLVEGMYLNSPSWSPSSTAQATLPYCLLTLVLSLYFLSCKRQRRLFSLPFLCLSHPPCLASVGGGVFPLSFLSPLCLFSTYFLRAARNI